MARKKKNPTIDSQDEFDEKMKSLSGSSAIKVSKAKAVTKKTPIKKVVPKKLVVKKATPAKLTKVSAFNSYVVIEEDYNIFHLYKSYYGIKANAEKMSGFYAGGVLARAIGDLERRSNIYLKTTQGKTKKELQKAMCDDLNILKKKIMEM